MPEPILTAGYTTRTPQGLKAYAEGLHAAIADIRYRPLSRLPEWRRDGLAQLLGSRYCHLPLLGNRNYRSDGPIAIVDLAQGATQVEALLGAWPHVLLLCVCRDLETCHRKVVAEHLHVWLDVGWEEAPAEGRRRDLPRLF